MFLPEGVTFEEIPTEDQLIPTNICQADDAGPAFSVNVRILPIKEYRAVFNKIKDNTGGFRQSNSANDKVDRDYLKRVIKGWSGLTLDNWNLIVRDGKKLSGPKNAEIQYSEDAAFYLYRNTWPQDFGNKIFEVVQAGAEEQEVEEEEVKKAS